MAREGGGPPPTGPGARGAVPGAAAFKEAVKVWCDGPSGSGPPGSSGPALAGRFLHLALFSWLAQWFFPRLAVELSLQTKPPT